MTVTSPWLSTLSLGYPDPSPSLLSWVGPTHGPEHATAASPSAPRTFGGFQRAPPPAALSPRVCKLTRLTPARVGGTREDGVTLLSLSV